MFLGVPPACRRNFPKHYLQNLATDRQPRSVVLVPNHQGHLVEREDADAALLLEDGDDRLGDGALLHVLTDVHLELAPVARRARLRPNSIGFEYCSVNHPKGILASRAKLPWQWTVISKLVKNL